MNEQTLALQKLEQKLKIMNLNYWEHFKFAHELNQALGSLDPKYQQMQKIVNKIIHEKHILQQQIERISKEKSETD